MIHSLQTIRVVWNNPRFYDARHADERTWDLFDHCCCSFFYEGSWRPTGIGTAPQLLLPDPDRSTLHMDRFVARSTPLTLLDSTGVATVPNRPGLRVVLPVLHAYIITGLITRTSFQHLRHREDWTGVGAVVGCDMGLPVGAAELGLEVGDAVGFVDDGDAVGFADVG